ncbi:thymidine kinase [bacterium]|nr:thymidine kinase [bacterium]
MSPAHPRLRSLHAGWIEVIAGGMFSGKSEELIRRLRRAAIARQSVQAFKPSLDDRYDAAAIVSHDERRVASTPVADVAALRRALAPDTQVVGIDEAQFLGPELVPLCVELARRGKRVIVAGLDMDYCGEPFEPIPQLMAVAEEVTKTHAVCLVCGAPASHSQRIAAGSGRVLVGAAEAYEPRCRDCFEPPAAAVGAPAAAAADADPRPRS